MTDEKRNEYMKRLEQEYEQFRLDMCAMSTVDVFGRAQDIVNMKYAYDYLRSEAISGDALEYIMKAKNPIAEVAGIRQAFD